MSDPRQEDRERYAEKADWPKPGEKCPVCGYGVHRELEALGLLDGDWAHEDCIESHEMGRRP